MNRKLNEFKFILMKRQFKYPKHFEEQKKIPKLTQKRIQLAEISLGDFEGRLAN